MKLMRKTIYTITVKDGVLLYLGYRAFRILIDPFLEGFARGAIPPLKRMTKELEKKTEERKKSQWEERQKEPVGFQLRRD